MKLFVTIEKWPLPEPVAISGYVFDDLALLFVVLEDKGCFGRGEAYGVYYHGETAASMLAQVETVRPIIEAGITREALRELLLPGGARSAVDAALWEIESQQQRMAVWQLAGLAGIGSVVTCRTLWAGAPDAMAVHAARHAALPILKLKLLGDAADSDRVAAVRAAAPAARLCIDANQGLDRKSYLALLPALIAASVEMIEQPFPIGQEGWIDGLARPIPVTADETVLCLADIPSLIGRFDLINIKLDKCGGLTEGLLMKRTAEQLGLGVMVGCMMATSLSMAPAFILAQGAAFADIDGPLYLAADRPVAMDYRDGAAELPDALWGAGGEPWHRVANAP